MKLKTLLLMVCFSLFTNAFAANQHFFKGNENKSSVEKNVSYPGYCEIEIINDSYTDVFVSGFLDSRTYLDEFTIYRYNRPHYISLFYNNNCYPEMMLTIRAPYYGVIYSAWTPRYRVVHIVPYLGGVKVETKDR